MDGKQIIINNVAESWTWAQWAMGIVGTVISALIAGWVIKRRK